MAYKYITTTDTNATIGSDANTYMTTTAATTAANTSAWIHDTTTATATWADYTIPDTSHYILTPPTLKIPTLEDFDSDYDKDTQDTEDPLKIMKRLARGCYKGNSCKKCNNERIEEKYKEKYGYISIPISAHGTYHITYDYSLTTTPPTMTWQYDEA